MWLAELWRYPVKSMGGEPLAEAAINLEGIPGDRVVHIEDQRGRVVTSRSRPHLLLHHATLGTDGEPRVDGRPWARHDVADDVRKAAGAGTHLVRDDGPAKFDVLPLLVATDGAIAALGYDSRRFRPNLLIGGVAGLAERSWEGSHLHIGEAVIRMIGLRRRCVMTTFDPDTAAQDVKVLLRIHRELDGLLALDCAVIRPGTVKVGDPVEIRPGGPPGK